MDLQEQDAHRDTAVVCQSEAHSVFVIDLGCVDRKCRFQVCPKVISFIVINYSTTGECMDTYLNVIFVIMRLSEHFSVFRGKETCSGFAETVCPEGNHCLCRMSDGNTLNVRD